MVLAALLSFLVFIAPTTFASPGMLDPSFGSNGVVTTSIPGYSAVASGVAVQPDGRIIIAGTAFNAAVDISIHLKLDRCPLARYLPSGALDPSFGGTGIVTAPTGPMSYEGVAIQSDGKIVVAGTIESTSFAIAVTRYLRNGQLEYDLWRDGYCHRIQCTVWLSFRCTSGAARRQDRGFGLDQRFGFRRTWHADHPT